MDRPFMSMSADEIEAHAKLNWTDREIIRSLVHELMQRRSRRANLAKNMLSARLLALSGIQIKAADTRSQVPVNPPPLREVNRLKVGKAFDLYPWQSEALRAWRKAGSLGIIEAVTGAGKTVLGLTAIREHIINGGRATVVVPTIELMNQWRDRLVEHLPAIKIALLGDGHHVGHGTCDVLIASVHMASRYKISPDSGSSLIIADEVHRLAAEKFSLALEDNFTYRLGLSATWQRDDDRHETVLRPYFGDVVFQLNYARARAEQAICAFRFAMIGVPLTHYEQADYEEAGRDASRWRYKLVKEFGAPDNPDSEFFSWVQRARNGAIPNAAKAAGIYWSAISKQRAVLAECNGKQIFAQDIAEVVKSAERTLAFTMTIEAAEHINNIWRKGGVQSSTFHSKLTKDSRRALLERFRSGSIEALIAPKVLDEGFDVPDADLGLILATSKSRIQLIQRIGRVLRRKADDRTARVALLYAKNTREDPSLGAHSLAMADIAKAADEFWITDANEHGMILDFLNP